MVQFAVHVTFVEICWWFHFNLFLLKMSITNFKAKLSNWDIDGFFIHWKIILFEYKKEMFEHANFWRIFFLISMKVILSPKDLLYMYWYTASCWNRCKFVFKFLVTHYVDIYLCFGRDKESLGIRKDINYSSIIIEDMQRLH